MLRGALQSPGIVLEINGSFCIFSEELQVPSKLQEIYQSGVWNIFLLFYPSASGFSLLLFQLMGASYLFKFKRVGLKSITIQLEKEKKELLQYCSLHEISFLLYGNLTDAISLNMSVGKKKFWKLSY